MQDVDHIHFSHGDLSSLSQHLETAGLSPSMVVILVDSNTALHCLPNLMSALPEFGEATVLEIPAGEQSKQLATLEGLYDSMMDLGADRSCLLISLGGGVVTDLGGLLASTYKRGISFVHLPTSLLGQVDAAIGGKTGIDHRSIKNVIGTFARPSFVFIHEDFLNSLPLKQVMSGLAEIIKHALIADRSLWESIVAQEELSLAFIKTIIAKAVEIKRSIVAIDPLEKGERKKLNFGHTVGHALESFALESTSEDLLHGHAVAFGMLCESHISHARGSLTESEWLEIEAFLSKHYGALELGGLSHHHLIEIMSQDKKRKGSSLNMTLLNSIGSAEIDVDPAIDHIIDSLSYLSRPPAR